MCELLGASGHYNAFVCAFCALTLAHRARCAAAILLRAALLMRRAGLDALACFTFAHRARWADAILARVAAEKERRFRVALA